MTEVCSLPSEQLIIFDCDGVLVDSEPLANTLLEEALLPYFGKDAKRVTENSIGRSFSDIRDQIEKQLSTKLPNAFWENLQDKTLIGLASTLRPDPALREFLESLSSPFCVASSGSHQKIRTSLAAAELLDLFDHAIFSAEDVTIGKPAPDLFLLASGRYRTAAKNCLVIEDSHPGLEAARAAGMSALHFVPNQDFLGPGQINQLQMLVEYL